MVRVTVRFLSIVRQRVGMSGVDLSFSEDRLGNVVQEIVAMYGIADLLMTEDGKIRSMAKVLVNGRSEEFLLGLDTRLAEGDRIALVYPYAETF